MVVSMLLNFIRHTVPSYTMAYELRRYSGISYMSSASSTTDPSGLVSRHRSDVVGCAQPSARSARRIVQPIPRVLASDATPRCASMASADRQTIGAAPLGHLRFPGGGRNPARG